MERTTKCKRRRFTSNHANNVDGAARRISIQKKIKQNANIVAPPSSLILVRVVANLRLRFVLSFAYFDWS
jgi:hypothetical protein